MPPPKIPSRSELDLTAYPVAVYHTAVRSFRRPVVEKSLKEILSKRGEFAAILTSNPPISPIELSLFSVPSPIS